MILLGLRTLIYPSNDLQSDKEWWAEALGTRPYFEEPFYVGFNVGGYELGLDPNLKADSAPKTYFGVTDIKTAIKYFEDTGCKVVEGPDEPGDGIVVCTLRMPNNQRISIIENPHIKADQTLVHID